MNNIPAILDICLLAAIMLTAGDATRQISAVSHPIRSIAFALVTVGAFGWIGHDLSGSRVEWWELSLHGGFATYSAIHFRFRGMTRRSTDVKPMHKLRTH